MTMTVSNLVTLKAVGKYELLLNKLASEVSLLNIQVRLVTVKKLVTLKAVAKYELLFNKLASEVNLLSMQVRLKQHHKVRP